MSRLTALSTPTDLFAATLKRLRGVLLMMAMFSGVINIMLLAGSLFMLQVYDRVLPSRSVPTLIALVGIVALVYAVQTALETIRARLVIRVGRAIDETLAGPAFQATVTIPLTVGAVRGALDPTRDLDHVRQFVGSSGPAALFDLPWAPLYVVICFLFHPWLGWLTLGGAAVVSALAIWGEVRARGATVAAAHASALRQSLIDEARRNAEVLATMNLAARARARFEGHNRQSLAKQQASVDSGATISAVVRGLRMLLQSLVLALAALLAIRQEISPGTIIATSILSSRALAPIDAAVAQWRLFVGARQAVARLRGALSAAVEQDPQTSLPMPSATLSIAGGVVAPPGSTAVTVANLNFSVQAGDGLGVIGPSGSGKTTLARVLTGAWPLARGDISLDGAPLRQYAADIRGAAMGYLPQDVDLFDGTIAENIARFDPDRTDEAVVRAGRLATVHGMILKFPDGYDTRIGVGGLTLSAGQRQRIGLARALYGDPFVVVLDEPYSNLDGEGNQALNQALAAVRARGGIVVLVAHHGSALATVNKLVAIVDGRQVAFGPKDEVLAQISQMQAPTPAPVPKPAGEGDRDPAATSAASPVAQMTSRLAAEFNRPEPGAIAHVG